ncbi:MAG TPA: autotransporter-associated beta strand repeat-containing protein [Gemmataceae bacterium]|nr:autotransporter-associated beta strand repeat-containing protein [Gemmataceae bacterium]
MGLFGWRRWLRQRAAAWGLRRPRPRRVPRRRLTLEALEDRLTPATLMWTGGAFVGNLWSAQDVGDPGTNWIDISASPQRFAIPQNGDDLVFPAGAANQANTDDIAGLSVRSITFQASGYFINASAGTSLTVTGSISDQAARGSNGLAVPLVLPNTTPIGVTQSAEVLLLETQISGTGGLTKTGAGGLFEFGPANTYAGATQVSAGLLFLAKAGAVPGALAVGTGTATPAQVLLNANAATAPTTAVTVNSDGLFAVGEDGSDAALASFVGSVSSDTIGSLALTGGTVSIAGPQFQGDIPASVLTLGGDVTTNASGTTATIGGAGFLSLGGPTRTFTVADGAADTDLLITAAVVDGGNGAGLVKAGAGRLVLSGGNSYGGGTDVTAGELQVQGNTALGTGPATVEAGAALELQPPLSESPNGQPGQGVPLSLLLANDITLNGAGVGGTGALHSLFGANFLSGTITLQSGSTVGVEPGSLQLSGPIGGPGGLTKVGTGSLLLSGSAANTYGGPTAVNAGLVILAKSPGVVAVPHDLMIGNGTGPSTSSLGSSTMTTAPTTVLISSDEQIADGARVTIASDGILNINLASETIGSLAGSGRVQFGAGSSTFSMGSGSNTPTLGGGDSTFTLGGDSTFTLGGGSSTSTLSGPTSGSLAVGADNTSTAYAGTIVGTSGRLIKIGGGVLVLQASSPFGGSTAVNGGTLRVDGSLTASAVAVNAGGTLGGSGTVGPTTVNPGGTVSPGDSPGVLSVQGGITFSPGSVILIEVNGPAAGSGYDQLRVSGPIALNGATLRLALGFSPAQGQDFVFLVNNGPGPVSGTFAGMPEDALLAHGNTFFDLSYAGGADGDLLSLSRGDLFVRALFADFNTLSSRATRAPFEGRVDGGESRLTVARQFFVSPARRLGEVLQFYQAFGQPLDGRLGGFVAQLLAGVPAGQVLINFLTSAPFRRLHRSNTAFVKALFAGLLGHPPGRHDHLGHHPLAFYLAELNGGTATRAGLARQLLSSDEVYSAAVLQNFTTFLGLRPTAAQLQTLTGQLVSGGLMPDTLSTAVITQEGYIDFFIARAGANRAPGVVLVNV